MNSVKSIKKFQYHGLVNPESGTKFVQKYLSRIHSTLAKIRVFPNDKIHIQLNTKNMGAYFSSDFLPMGDIQGIALITCSVVSVVVMLKNIHKLPPWVYDKLILNMTEVWYQTVLDRVKEGSRILDIGIGTAGALLRCKDTLLSKQISVVGIDYNDLYVKAAQFSIEQHNLQSAIQVEHKSVYDIATSPPGVDVLQTAVINPNSKHHHATMTTPIKPFDAAYFSGSISLLPDPPQALRAVAAVVKPGGLIYITQTYQKRTFPLLQYIKPWIKYVTSIDFGQLVMVNEVEERLWKNSGLEAIEHEIIPGSINHRYQAAYLTILRVPNMLSQ